jgi:hypothetical protein
MEARAKPFGTPSGRRRVESPKRSYGPVVLRARRDYTAAVKRPPTCPAVDLHALRCARGANRVTSFAMAPTLQKNRTPSGLVNYRLTLPPEMHTEARTVAGNRGLTLAELLRNLLFEFLNTANGCPQCGKDRHLCGHVAPPVVKVGRPRKVAA